jgi:hypothetical protein
VFGLGHAPAAGTQKRHKIKALGRLAVALADGVADK